MRDGSEQVVAGSLSTAGTDSGGVVSGFINCGQRTVSCFLFTDCLISRLICSYYNNMIVCVLFVHIYCLQLLLFTCSLEVDLMNWKFKFTFPSETTENTYWIIRT